MLEIDQIYCGDCLELMKELPDKSIDLVLTDPPYGIQVARRGSISTTSRVGFGGGRFGRKNRVSPKKHVPPTWDNSPPSPEYFAEIFRVSKNQIIFGGNYFGLPPSPCWIVWDKDNGTNDFADCELAWTSFKTSIRKFKYRWNGMLQEDMKHKEKRYHPTQKPVKLFMQILQKYSSPGDLVLDPFLGSGTTAIACRKLNMHYIGIEREPEYIEIARKRLAAMPTSLYGFAAGEV
mgnify:FL=1